MIDARLHRVLRGQRTNVPRQDKADLAHRELIQHALQDVRDAALVQVDTVDRDRLHAILLME